MSVRGAFKLIRERDEWKARAEQAEADREAHAEALKAMTAERDDLQRSVDEREGTVSETGPRLEDRPSRSSVPDVRAHAVVQHGDVKLEGLPILTEQAESQVAALTAEIAQPHERKKG